MIGQLSSPWWVFIVLDICAGLMGGALGLGGGTIIVPTLVLICGFGQKSAQGMALAVMAPLALAGALRYWRNPEIEMNLLPVGLIICGALVGVLVGTELASRLPGHILRKAFAAVLVIAALKMFMTSAKPGRAGLDNSMTEQKTVSSLKHGEINNESEI
ncbi:MAG: sulfite exporter TauE/SafE family protein [Planctomycetes bacterium]|nr:sulfite exporter TauE/SafE family protein [Planctomycetota bacterium]MBL7144383.1 sulfite exporter TauE/SafE family protein [Phycisphaerae bacterium]